METGILCLCVITLMGAMRETAPTLFSNPQVPGLPFPPPPSPLSVLSIFVSLSTHSLGGPSLSLLQALQGEGKEFGEGVRWSLWFYI